VKRFVATVLAASALLLTGCDKPDEKCKPEEEGKSKFYDTGHIITCKNGKWVLENGIGFQR
jgi:hypothetical protein